MARLHETLETTLPTDRAFAFIADFANAQQWDPGVVWSSAASEEPPAIGSCYQLGVRMGNRVLPMEYRITTLEHDARVVLEGSGSGVQAVDDIRFESTATGTRIDYLADIRLTGMLRLVAPFAGRAFASIAGNARTGMQQTLDRLSEQGPAAAGRGTDR
jgi:carbon monoxide dehydrogenase subunit G